jgi:prepilin-type N-terminal cleavage/methylation domain-containing protein
MSDMKQVFRRNGFTLIEMLVVISIIGILSGILYASFGKSKDLARNNAIQAELKEVQLALHLYKSQNGRYPEAETSCDSTSGTVITADSSACGATPIIADLIPDFIGELSLTTDSSNSNCNFSYKTDAGGTWYKYTAERCAAGVTGTTGVQAGDEFARCLATCPGGTCDAAYQATPAFYESYAVYSAGGECE